jgi:hypothetical protein
MPLGLVALLARIVVLVVIPAFLMRPVTSRGAARMLRLAPMGGHAGLYGADVLTVVRVLTVANLA